MTAYESAVIDVVKEVIRSRGLPVPSLTRDTVLEATLGLESLDFAEIVVRMEELTGKDPFADGTPLNVRTISDLAALYDAPNAASA